MGIKKLCKIGEKNKDGLFPIEEVTQMPYCDICECESQKDQIFQVNLDLCQSCIKKIEELKPKT